MMGGGGGGQTADSSTGRGGVFIPPNQAGAADALNQLILPLLGLSANGGAGTPAARYLPFAESSVMGGLANNPFANQAIAGSDTASQNAFNFVAPDAFRGATQLNQTAGAGLPFASTALQQGFDPAYGAALSSIQNNPYYGQALSGAQGAAGMGATGANAIEGLAEAIGGQTPELQSLARAIGGQVPELQGLARGVAGEIPKFDALSAGVAGEIPKFDALASGVAGQIPRFGALADKIGGTIDPLLSTGFDPRSALFKRSQGRLMDQTNAINAMSGLDRTPYGASVTGNAMSNFDIDWENQQQARQIAATNAAGSAAGTAGGLLGQGVGAAGAAGNLYGQGVGAAGQASNILGQGVGAAGAAGNLFGQAGASAGQAGNLYGQAGQSANTASNLYGAAPGLLSSTSGLPSGVYTNNISQILSALQARNRGAEQGAAGFGSILGSGGTALGQGNALNMSGIGAQNTFGAAPYNTSSTIGQNAISGLTNLTNLGNNQFQLPQQEIGNLMQYMGLGQSASGLSGQLGNLGFQQTAQGLGGALSGANTLFGQNGILGSGSGGGGLFGGGGSVPASSLGGLDLSAAGTNLGGSSLSTGLADAFGNTIAGADLGGAAAAGGGLDLAAAAPFALSA